MRYQEITRTVIGSTTSDWEQIGGTHLFIYGLGEVQSADQHWVSVDYHHSLAVYKPDVNLRLAWGLEEDRDLSFRGMNFPDRQVRRASADAFWQGALVARWTYLVVDGGRCYLPEVREAYDGQQEHPFNSEQWQFRALEASASDVAVARLLKNLLGRPEASTFSAYMRQAKIAEVPDPD
jgi:hypothetical protein